jgi:nucleoid-associated protein YgaU
MKMKLTRMKISLLGLLVVSVVCVIIQSGCQKTEGPEHKVAMTPAESDKPMMVEVRAADDASEDAEGPEPVAFNPSGPTHNNPAPLAEIDHSVDEARLYRVKADDTYWKIASRELGNGQRWREIKSLNPDLNPNALKIGQTIRIPVR